MAKLIGAQRMVLQAISDLPMDASESVTDTQIAHSTHISIGDVRDWLKTLADDGHVNLVRTTHGLSASITAQGRLALGLYQPIGTAASPPSQSGPSPASPGR